ncbi:MAG: FtsX-like permease family protein [Proteobacteria bacterium]|nr:FtsX-like permease family protein [Pseudomonadota bacterium]MBU1739372.1 FtsX-like permease family protein [Pseudomonadota bacterium]
MKNLGVMLVFTAVIFLLASFQILTGSLTRTAEILLERSPEIIIQKMTAGRQENIPVAYAEKLSGLFGIRTIAPRVWGYYFDETSGANYTVLAVDPEVMPYGKKIDEVIVGHFPKENEHGVVLGRYVVQSLGLGERKQMSLFRPDLTLKSLTVTGYFPETSNLLTGDLLALTLADARDLFAIPPEYATDFCVYVNNPNEIETTARKIAAILPDTRVLTSPQIRKTYQVVFGWRSGFASICLLSALVAFIIMAWDKASGLSPEEKREIGILKVLGWQTSDILTLRMWEGLVLSGVSFLAGYTAAYMHVLLFEGSLFRPVLIGWSVIHPALKLVPEVATKDMLLVFSLAVLPYMAATIIPAWRSSTIPPDAAIK